MLNYKNLIITLVSLIAVLLIICIFAPKGAKKAHETSSENESNISDEYEFVFEEEEVPDGYVSVLGYEDVYRIVVDGVENGYVIQLPNGEYEPYDINRPKTFVLSDELRQIYKVVDVDGKLVFFRHYNGREWDVVDKTGEVMLAIPENYTRYDNSGELYKYKDSENEYLMRIVVFNDQTYAWEEMEKIPLIVETTTIQPTTEPETKPEEPKEEEQKEDESQGKETEKKEDNEAESSEDK